MDKVVVFDLDDTLYKEIDYLRSAYWEIALWIESFFGRECKDGLGEDLQNGLFHDGRGVDAFQRKADGCGEPG